MQAKKFIFLGLIAVAAVAAFFSSTGCANIVPPGGGPRDSLPPVLVKANPQDSMLGFNNNRITFTFDEYVELDNYQQNLIVSPVPESMPVVNRNLQTVTVRLRDTLEPNTTYTLDFGNSIKDVNEGNIFRNFTYTFSTGAYFDSLRFSGRILLAETGDTDSTMTIMLHRSGDDSALVKQKPRYVARPDNKGGFTFKNLPPGTYYLYALKDESGSYRYFDRQALFAFADSAITITGAGTDSVTLYAYTEPREEKTTSTPVNIKTIKSEDRRIKIATSLENERQDLLKPFSMDFITPIKEFDSSKVRFATDTTFAEVTGYSWQFDSLRKKLSLQHAWKENTLYHLMLEKDFATDTLGFQLFKADTISFTTKRLNEYGKVNIRFRNLEQYTHPILLFVQSNRISQSIPLTGNTLNIGLFPPGEYDLRILDDKNQNGVWDAGRFFGERRQPEIVRPLNRKLTIKPGVDVPVEIDAADIRRPGPAETGAPGINAVPGQQPAPRRQPGLLSGERPLLRGN